MEGVKRYQVRLAPHNPQWASEFEEVRAQLRERWRGNLLDVQHVGSTAILGICAKPILDVAVQLRSVGAMDVAALQEVGYEYCGPQHGSQTYHLFVLRGEGQLSLRHIHCYDQGDGEFAQLVGFRDYLNSHPQAAQAYQALKRRLACQYPDDRAAYTQGKAAFINSIYARLGATI